MNATVEQELCALGRDTRMFAEVFRFSPILHPAGVQHRLAGVGQLLGMSLQMFRPDLLTRRTMPEVTEHGWTHTVAERPTTDGLTRLKELKWSIHVSARVTV